MYNKANTLGRKKKNSFVTLLFSTDDLQRYNLREYKQ